MNINYFTLSLTPNSGQSNASDIGHTSIAHLRLRLRSTLVRWDRDRSCPIGTTALLERRQEKATGDAHRSGHNGITGRLIVHYARTWTHGGRPQDVRL